MPTRKVSSKKSTSKKSPMHSSRTSKKMTHSKKATTPARELLSEIGKVGKNIRRRVKKAL